MLDPEEQARSEQTQAYLGEWLPGVWKSLYDGCVARGFDRYESFKLLQTYILSQAPNGVNGIN